jgi:hypothetical protein
VDNIQTYVLVLVLEHLAGMDVVSVSHAFHAAAVPRLYVVLHSRMRQVKGIPFVCRIRGYDPQGDNNHAQIQLPFAVTLAHRGHISHVREIGMCPALRLSESSPTTSA